MSGVWFERVLELDGEDWEGKSECDELQGERQVSWICCDTD